MNTANLADFMEAFTQNKDFCGEIKTDENLSPYCTMHTGGRAKAFIEVFDEKSLAFAVKTASLAGQKFFLLGGGSNVILPDEGLELVICTRKLGKDSPVSLSKKGVIRCSAGARWGTVLDFCKKNNLGGLEAFTSLSGTAGGAVFMNACCFSLAACDRLLTVRYLDTQKNEIFTYKTDKKDWGYKKSPFQPAPEKLKGGVAGALPPQEGEAENAAAVGAGGRLPPQVQKIILSAEFFVEEGFDENFCQEVRQKRIELGHFKAPSAGSAFKNDPDKKITAGKLIDQCGLKGFSAGGAMVAPWHGNFIINPEQKASSRDVRQLVEYVRKTVFEKTGILLEPEIIFA